MPKAKQADEEMEDNDKAADGAGENEPIYYKPKMLSLISTIASWTSWVVLVGTLLVIAAQIHYLQTIAQQNGTAVMAMLTDAQQGEQARIYVYTSMILPLFTGVSSFLLLQAASIGLNALLEIEFNQREPRS